MKLTKLQKAVYNEIRNHPTLQTTQIAENISSNKNSVQNAIRSLLIKGAIAPMEWKIK